jgi:hypothetical protein
MGSEQARLAGMAWDQNNQSPEDRRESSPKEEANGAGKPRFKQIDREQMFLRMVDVELLIPEDHAARAIWELVGRLDLSRYRQKIRAVEGVARSVRF